MQYSIEKRGYSVNPWRLVCDGEEVSVLRVIDHPDLGEQLVPMPFCAATKTELVDMLLREFGRLQQRARSQREMANSD